MAVSHPLTWLYGWVDVPSTLACKTRNTWYGSV